MNGLLGLSRNRTPDQQTQIAVVVITLLGMGLRLFHLAEQSLWFDEIVTVALARVSWYGGLVGLLGQGIQLTPLFHWVIKLWLAVGDSDWLVRVPSMAVGVITIPLIFKLGRFYFDDKVGVLAALIFALNPFQVWYGQEVKLYTLVPLSAAGAMVAFGQMLRTRGRRGLLQMMLFNLLGFTAHYFVFLVSTVQFLCLVITLKRTYSRLRPWVIAQGVPILALVPWWLFIIQQQHFAVGVGWIPRPHWWELLLTWWNFSFGYTGKLSITTVLFLAVAGLGLGLGLRRAWDRPMRGKLMTLWLAFPPIIALVLSMGRMSFYVDRYLLIISPVLTVLTVAGLSSLRPQWLRWGAILFLAAATGLGLLGVYFDRDTFTKNDWRALARSVDAQARPGDTVITCTDGYRLAFEYYNPHQTLGAGDVVIFGTDEYRLAFEYDYSQDLSGGDGIAAPQSADAGTPTPHPAAWIITLHYRPPIHYLGWAFPPILDTALLSPEGAAWQMQHLRDEIAVAGISAYRYELLSPLHLDEITRWHCNSFKLWQKRGAELRRPGDDEFIRVR